MATRHELDDLRYMLIFDFRNTNLPVLNYILRIIAPGIRKVYIFLKEIHTES